MKRSHHLPAIALGAGLALSAMASGASAEGVTFTDVDGNEITLDGPASRIVSIVNPIAGTLLSIAGTPDPIVGINPSIKGPLTRGILGELFPQIAGIPDNVVVGGTSFAPNVEAIAALHPDIVIQWGDREDDLVAPIRNAGLTVALHRYILGDHELTENNMIAGMLAVPERGIAFNQRRERVWNEIAEVAAGISDADRISVLQVHLLTAGVITAYGVGTPSDVHIRHIGATNPAYDLNGFVTVNSEQVAAWDPDVILVMADDPDALSILQNDPLLSHISAVRHRQTYLIPIGTARWGSSTQDDPLFWMWMANIFYPQVFAYDIRAEVTDMFEDMYGHRLTEDQLDSILRASGNRDSARASSFLR